MAKLMGSGKIFAEIQMGSLKVPNRIAAAPFLSRLASPEGYATPELIDYWRQRASGDVGFIIVEAAFIDQKCSRLQRNQLGVFSDDCHVGLATLSQTIQLYGAKACLQLAHAGRQTRPTEIWGNTPIAPSPIPCPFMTMVLGRPNSTREITIEQIKEVVVDFAHGARRAKEAGFDAVELHFAHGYLVASFFSRHTNKREDEYGGSLENRAKIGLEILKRCHEETGADFPIGVRISGDEFLPDGLTLNESKVISKWFEETGAAYIHVSASNYETVETQCPTIYQKRGLLLDLASGIKEVVSVPVIAVASITPDLAVKVIEEDQADLVAIGRGLNADPHLVRKMAEGRMEDIIPCIRCNRCIEAESNERPTMCDTNFLTGRRIAYPIVPVSRPTKVVIVGGGPGGLEAARVAATRGCGVKLYEQNDRLGGALIAASVPDFMQEFRELRAYYETQLRKLEVDLVLNHTVTSETIQTDQPDTLILALGAQPLDSKVPGSDRALVSQGVDAVLGKVSLRDKILLIGGNYISCQIAAHLAQQGRKVTLASVRKEESQLARELEPISQYVIVRLLKKLKVEIALHHNLVEITDDGGIFQVPGKNPITIQADNILLSLGFSPKKEEANQFKGLARRVFAIGDCVRPRRVGPAIHEGFIAGYEA